MKILIWNLQRLEKNKNTQILEILSDFDADIVILTETNASLVLGEKYYHVSTQNLPSFFDNQNYRSGENRVTIWSKTMLEKQIETSDEFTSVFAHTETEIGVLNIYATITGVFGGSNERFKRDLENQIQDFEKLRPNLIAGDLNTFFSGYAYPSHLARKRFNELFDKLNLQNLTSEIRENVDHIVLDRNLISNRDIKIGTWNENKKLSDHIGICVTLK